MNLLKNSLIIILIICFSTVIIEIEAGTVSGIDLELQFMTEAVYHNKKIVLTARDNQVKYDEVKSKIEKLQWDYDDTNMTDAVKNLTSTLFDTEKRFSKMMQEADQLCSYSNEIKQYYAKYLEHPHMTGSVWADVSNKLALPIL